MTTLLSFLLVIGILVVVHEYGHYLAARWSGVKVLKFSVGFGRPLLSHRYGRDRTEWAVGLLPLGGYVKMLDEREGPVAAEELPRAFNRATVWRRMMIAAAGPLANFLLAIVVFWILFVHGLPALKPVIGEPGRDTPAALAGLKDGDEIARIDGNPVQTFADLHITLLDVASRKGSAVLELANGEQRTLELGRVDVSDMENGADIIGLRPYSPPLAPVIGRVERDSVAERAGLSKGDRILAVNDDAIESWQAFSKAVRAHPGREIHLLVEGATGERRTLRIAPAAVTERGALIGRVGAGPEVDPELFKPLRTEQRYGLIEAMGRAVEKTWDTVVFNLKMLGRMVLGEVSWRNLSGPISIADYAGQTAQQGWISFLGFLAVISIGLGIINLLPVPLLDGGHLVYYIFEVFRGRPLSDKVQDIGARIGVVVLGALIFTALFNDIVRQFSR